MSDDPEELGPHGERFVLGFIIAFFGALVAALVKGMHIIATQHTAVAVNIVEILVSIGGAAVGIYLLGWAVIAALPRLEAWYVHLWGGGDGA